MTRGMLMLLAGIPPKRVMWFRGNDVILDLSYVSGFIDAICITLSALRASFVTI